MNLLSEIATVRKNLKRAQRRGHMARLKTRTKKRLGDQSDTRRGLLADHPGYVGSYADTPDRCGKHCGCRPRYRVRTRQGGGPPARDKRKLQADDFLGDMDSSPC